MSVFWLIVVALLLGTVIYRSFYTLVKSVRLAVACLFMVAFFLIVQNLETIGHTLNSAGAWHVPFSPDKRATDVAFQNIIREDRNFLDELTQTLSHFGHPPGIPSPGIEKELADNTVHVERAVLVPHQDIVKRARLVTQNEASKRAELVRSGQR